MSRHLQLTVEEQKAQVADEVSALYATVRPILLGLLGSLQSDVVKKLGGKSKIDLQMLGRARREGDGDCGICFEYAVHDAIKRREPRIIEKISDAMRQCKVPGSRHESILFGLEKHGAQQIIATAQEVLTDDSRLLTGRQSQPPKLKNYLNILAGAFKKPTTRASLPTSINGLWKADLFLGCTDSDRWIGTSVKINPRNLEGANGLRVGIVPASQGRSDSIRKDESKNLIVCPLPYDSSFMEIFYHSWTIVQTFLKSDARLPREVELPSGSHRQVARYLEERRNFPVVDVVDAMSKISQPHLLDTNKKQVSFVVRGEEESLVDSIISPIASWKD